MHLSDQPEKPDYIAQEESYAPDGSSLPRHVLRGEPRCGYPENAGEESKDDFSSLHRTTIALLVFCFGDNTHLALPLDCC